MVDKNLTWVMAMGWEGRTTIIQNPFRRKTLCSRFSVPLKEISSSFPPKKFLPDTQKTQFIVENKVLNYELEIAKQMDLVAAGAQLFLDVRSYVLY